MEICKENTYPEVMSYLEKYRLEHSEKKWLCEHYHRERIDETDNRENRPNEEEVCYYVHSKLMGDQKIQYYDVKKSDLVPISDKECQCSKCGQVYKLEKMKQMEQVFERMNELYDMNSLCFSDLQFLKLRQGLEPVWYRRKFDDTKEVIGVETDIRNWKLTGRGAEWKIPGKYAFINSFTDFLDYELNLKKIGLFCNHFQGKPSFVLKYDSDPVQPYLIGKAESYLFMESDGVCSCHRCGKEFSQEEQNQMNRLISYLNTPHYCLEEDMKYHKEWCEIFELYNLEYDDENEPFQLFDLQKSVELSKGVEPVWYDQRGGMKNRDVILSKMTWKNGAWRVRNKVKGFIKWGFR